MSALLPNEYAGIFPPAERARPAWEALRLPVALIIRALLRTYGGLRIEGAEHLPNDGSFVLVANHTSHLDALCLLAALPLGRLPQRFHGRGRGLFFSKPRAVLDRGADRERAPVHARQRFSRKPRRLRRSARAAGSRAPAFPRGHPVARREIAPVPQRDRRARRRARNPGAALPYRRRASLVAKGQTLALAALACGCASARRAGSRRGRSAARLRRNCTPRWRNSGTKMESTEHKFASWDGTELFYRAWLPNEKPPRRALLLFHRGHEHSGRWEETVGR